MDILTLDLYTVAREWMRFDGFDPYNTSPRIVDNMSGERYQRERCARGPVNEYDANGGIIGGAA